ncbi:KdsC family phosphatase [Francisella tularensis]|uniref:KdsC family phosphatase n=1 Tax=Francisella tularensis TaxID=263 RepID=UPI000173E549|nr:HAD-IIIA family hydrolase [Francisella tularensis]ACD30855.1 3-deoxy-D-manno-octulosonate 8-phosphate phosphatase [Francisella tularensis subsp. mediasiatica FSC147]MBK2077873.1 HAD-IIIA family hydrolase [Francisella tularensis subsp. mediasiatica]MBK2101935.1 HAD-IIIA family hydrolase [Francisella tularensis subsp. mediasiatica]MBK2103914.1 HAD-IIIA family hydrolase [Francisella tularensis subsp. mediasiatica]MDN9003276.1 HAD-IIIA family hydrolase [Francisella tularensis subsp. mediasiatic
MKINHSRNSINIKLLILDVDGVLTDGKIIVTNDGDELKNFDVKDGLGIVLMQKLGIKVAIVTGKQSKIVDDRFKNLGLDPEDILQGQKNKLKAYEFLKSKYKLNDSDIAYIGDDLPDIILMNKVAISAAPADAMAIAKDYADYVCKADGGAGAVREFCEYLIKQLNLYDKIVDDYIQSGGVR